MDLDKNTNQTNSTEHANDSKFSIEKLHQLAKNVSPADPTRATIKIDNGKEIPIVHAVLILSLQRKPIITYILTVLNIAMFALEEFLGGSENSNVLLLLGANFGELVINEGEWFRVLNACFLHIGFLHLLSNSVSLWNLGPLCEQVYGKSRFLLLYLSAGMFGNILSILFYGGNHISAGASGAIFGLLGICAVFPRVMKDVLPEKFTKNMNQQIIFWLIINLGITFSADNIDIGGHIGGLIIGIIFGLLFVSPSINPWKTYPKAIQWCIVLLGLVVLNFIREWISSILNLFPQ